MGEIKWDAETIVANNESFSGEYLDIPHARVLLLEDEERVAIVSLELVQPGNIVADLKTMISEKLSVPTSNIWIHCTHTTTTLHIRSDAAAAAVFAGVEVACDEALATFQDAVMGTGTVNLDINVNRNIAIPEGLDPAQWTGKNAYGFTGDEYSPKEMTVLRFDSAASGEPISVYMTYPMKPVGLDQSGKSTGTRLITSDIPGYACTMMEEELGAPCLFFMPAAGDQVSKESATVPGYLEDGAWGQGDLGAEAGIAIIEKYGKLMGDAAITLAQSITASKNNVDIQVAATSFAATGVNRGVESPVEVPVSAITIGSDVALVGFKPELDGITGTQLAESSPYDTTLLVAFMNGDSKYMPHYEAWDFNDGKGTQEVIDGAAYVRGTAETLVSEAVRLLNTMKSGTEQTETKTVSLIYQDIKIAVDGKTIAPAVEPFAIDGTTYLPADVIAEALDCEITWSKASNTVAIRTESTSHMLASIQENGIDAITSAAFDSYFKGTAAEGVKEILNAGKFFVNGFALPAAEGEFNINLGFITLVKTDDGWSSSVHKGNTSSPTFDEARLELADGLTKFAGLYVNLFDDDMDGYADRIQTTVKQSVRVDEIIVSGDTVKIDRTNFQVADKAGAGEINNVTFSAANVDPDLQVGDIGLYWEEPDGFHIDRCASKVGRLTEGANHGYYVFDGVRYEDIGGVTKYHLASANRPGQFLEAQRTLGLLGTVDVIAWTVGDYQLAGFTNSDAAAVLTQGISVAKAAAGSAAGASDSALSALEAQIAAAEAVLNDGNSTSADLDRAFYQLALAVDALTDQ